MPSSGTVGHVNLTQQHRGSRSGLTSWIRRRLKTRSMSEFEVASLAFLKASTMEGISSVPVLIISRVSGL